MSDDICTECRGAKRVQGYGFMWRKCEACGGTGKAKIVLPDTAILPTLGEARAPVSEPVKPTKVDKRSKAYREQAGRSLPTTKDDSKTD